MTDLATTNIIVRGGCAHVYAGEPACRACTRQEWKPVHTVDCRFNGWEHVSKC